MLQIESVNKQYSTRILLEGATAHLRPGSRVGLVGPNGAGKTTLFRMILEEESPDKGKIRKRPRLRIGYLPQELETITGQNRAGRYPSRSLSRTRSRTYSHGVGIFGDRL